MTDRFPELASYKSNFDRGRPFVVEAIWRVVSACFFQCPLFPFYAPKRFLLRLFGAKVGKGVLVKPRVTITFPWRLEVGDHSWIGEGVWLDNLAEINVGSNVCISQGAYLCTGNHDYRSQDFNLRTRSITLKKGSWVGAKSVVAAGVTLEEGAILSLGSVATQNLEQGGIYQGNPAMRVGER